MECGCYHKQDDAPELHGAFTTAEILVYLDGNLIWIDTNRQCSMRVLGKSKVGSGSLWTRAWVMLQACMGLTQTSWPMYTIPRSNWQHGMDIEVVSQGFGRCITTIQMVFPPFGISIHTCRKDRGIETWKGCIPAWLVVLQLDFHWCARNET